MNLKYSKKLTSALLLISSLFFFSKQSGDFLTEKEQFEIEIMDNNSPEDRVEMIELVFSKNNQKSICRNRMRLLLYKIYLDKSLENIDEIHAKQKKGKFMTEKEEDILVMVHLLEKYLDTVKNQGRRFSRRLALNLLRKERFNKFFIENHDAILKELNDEVFKNPFVLDAGIHHEEEKKNDILTIDL